MRGVERRIALGGLCLLAACAAAGSSLVPDHEEPRVRGHREGDAWQTVARAEALRELGEHEAAHRLVTGLLEDDPLFVPAARIYQNYLREQGRAGVLWREIEALKARFPDRPEPLYLEARIVPEFREKQSMIRAALERFPDSYWLRYAGAWCLARSSSRTERKRAREILGQLIRVDLPWPPVLLLAHHAASARVTPSPLLPRLRAMAERFPEDGRLDLLQYIGGVHEIGKLLSAVERVPASAELKQVLAERRVTDGHGRTLVRTLAGRPEVARRLTANGAGLLAARLALRHASPELAERWLLASCSELGASPAVELHGRLRTGLRELMQLWAGRGDIERAIALWESRVPAQFRDDGRSRIGARVQAVLKGPARGLRGKPESAERAAEALAVLLRAGWVEEAARLAARHVEWYPNDRRLAALRAEAEAFLLFEEGLVDLLGGPGRNVGSAGSLRAVLERVRELARRTIGRDVVGKPRFLEFPIVGGKLVDPFGPGLPTWLDHYNRHLVLGNLDSGKAVVMLGTKVRELRLPPSRSLPLMGRCYEVMIEHKALSTAASIGVSDPAGVALWNHYVIDLRAVRNWVDELTQTSAIVRRQTVATVLADPVANVGPLDMSRPGQVHWKLTARAMSEQGWSEERTWREVYELLQLHERAHLVDAHRFLPVGTHLGPALWLFAAAGFSAKSVQANLEGRAECAALALGAHPVLALGHLAGFVSEPYTSGVSVHQVGFKRVLRRILELWQEAGAPGASEPHKNLLAQLHRMPADLAVRYARVVLGEEGF